METEIEIREETPEIRPTEFLNDIPDEQLVTGKFVKKELFRDGMAVLLLGIGKSTFDDKQPKWDLYLEIEGEEKIMTVTSIAVKELKEKFGKPSEWHKKSCYIKAEPGEWQINGKKQIGYTLSFTKL